MSGYDVLIVGGGVVGFSTAFHLAESGRKKVLLLERDFPAAGATGRCGGGIRAQWSTPGNIRLAQHSISEFENFKDMTGQDIQFRQGGYLLPAYSREEAGQFKKNAALQKRHGVPVELVSPEQAREITPAVNTAGMLTAAYCPTDGVANPFLVTKGYADAAEKAGVEIRLRAEVTGFETSGPRVTAALLRDGTRIACGAVLNAAGGWAAAVCEMVGAKIPLKPYRHQIMVTEPLEIFHRPMVIDLHHNLYFCQAEEGGILAGQTDEDEPPSFNTKNSWRFIVEISRKLIYHCPALADVAVVRQWAGLYSMTPDAQPILGRVGEYDNFFCACGFSGHGFMISPAVGLLMAELLTHGRARTLSIEDYSADRFERGEFVREKSVV